MEKEVRCSFCGRNMTEVSKLINNGEAYICDRCVRLGIKIANGTADVISEKSGICRFLPSDDSGNIKCAFCNKNQDQVKSLFISSGYSDTAVCDECLETCEGILEKDNIPDEEDVEIVPQTEKTSAPQSAERKPAKRKTSFAFKDEPESNPTVRNHILHIINDELDYDGGFRQWDFDENGKMINIRRWDHHIPTAYLYGYARVILEENLIAEDEETHKRIGEIAKQFDKAGIDPGDVYRTFDLAWNIACRIGLSGVENMIYGDCEVPCYAFSPVVYDSNDDVPKLVLNDYIDRMKNYDKTEINLYIAFNHSLGIWREALQKNRGNDGMVVSALLDYKYTHIMEKVRSLENDFFSKKHEIPQMHPYIYDRIFGAYKDGLENDHFSPIILVGEDEQLRAIVKESAELFQRELVILDTSRPDNIEDDISQYKLLYICGDKKGKSINYERITSIRRGTIVIFGLSACNIYNMRFLKQELSYVLQDTYLNLDDLPDKQDTDKEITFLRKLADTAKLIYVRPERDKRLDEIRRSFNQFCMLRNVSYYDRRLPLLYLYSLEDLYDLDFYVNSKEFLSKYYVHTDAPVRFRIDWKDTQDKEFIRWMMIGQKIVLYSDHDFPEETNYGFVGITHNEDPARIKGDSSIPVIIDAGVGQQKIKSYLSELLDEMRLIYIISDPEDSKNGLGGKQISGYKKMGVMEIAPAETIFETISGVLLARQIREFFDNKLTMKIGPVYRKDDDDFVDLWFDRIFVSRSYKKDRWLSNDEPGNVIGQEDAWRELSSLKNLRLEKPFTILAGPSDVGKTMLITAFAYRRHFAVYQLPAFDLLKPGFEKEIKKMIGDISIEAPAIIHLDKLGSLFDEYERTKSDRIESALYMLESIIREKHTDGCEIGIIAESDTKIPDFVEQRSRIIRCYLPEASDFYDYFSRALPVDESILEFLARQCANNYLTIKAVDDRLRGTDLRQFEGCDADAFITHMLEIFGIKESTDESMFAMRRREMLLHPCPADDNEYSLDDIYIPDGSEVFGKTEEWLDILNVGYITAKKEDSAFCPVYGGIIHGERNIGKNFLVRCLAGELRNKTNGDAAEMFCIDSELYKDEDGYDTDRMIYDLRYILNRIQRSEKPTVLLLENIDCWPFNVQRGIVGYIDRLETKHQVLVLSTVYEPSDGHERTYVELLQFFDGNQEIVEKLGGFTGMLPPTATEYGAFLMKWFENENASLGDDGVYEALGEIFLSHGLTNKYIRLKGFLESYKEKYNKKLDAKTMLDEFHLKINGREMKNDDEYRKNVSLHEAGHAFMQQYFGKKPVLATIVSRGDYGGFVQGSARNSEGLATEEDYRNTICIKLAGMASEQVIFFGDENIRSAGAGGSDNSDLGQASSLAFRMVSRLGMGSKLFIPVERNTGRRIVRTADGRGQETYEFTKDTDIWNKECMDEADRILHEELKYTQKIISQNRDLVEKIAEVLQKEGTITADQIRCFEEKDIVRVTRK